jgi:hypothetical protein
VRRGRISVLLLTLAGSAAQAQTTSAFVTRLGRDTVMLERFTLRPGRLEGMLVTLFPRVRFREYEARITDRGQISAFRVTIRPGNASAEPVTAWEARLRNGHLTVVNRRETVDSATFAVSSPSVPYIHLAVGPYQAAVHLLRSLGGDSMSLALYGAGSREPIATWMARRGSDSIAVEYFGDELYLAVSPEGRLVGLNGKRTTQKFTAEPAPGLDLAAVAAGFIARERTGGIAGLPSPRDTALGRIAGASILVDYGRPSKRGRRILGEVVPFGGVWRTGANAATQLITDRDLQAGGARIPAGTYSLWTLPAEDEAVLILNRQTGQWGTQYDPTKDLVRLPLRVEQLATAVETFTISVEAVGAVGELRLDWDRVRWILPIRVAPP